MADKDSATRIDELAAQWVARFDAGNGDAAIRAELEQWLAGDRRRRGAFLRAQASWAFMDRASALTGIQAGPQSILEPPARVSRLQLRSSGALVAALAASIVVAVIATWPGGRHSTDLGEVSRIPLADGTVASLNTQSRLNVSIDAELRSVALLRGEAWFQVARDAKRPFVVAAGNVRVRALGTAFAVRRREGGADLLVTEGSVSAWRVGDEAHALRLIAGSKVYISDESPVAKVVRAPQEIDRSLAWRHGQVSLQGETLAQAVAEFNRYNARKLVIADERLAAKPLVGWFRTNEPEAFARAVASVHGARVVMGDDDITLARELSP